MAQINYYKLSQIFEISIDDRWVNTDYTYHSVYSKYNWFKPGIKFYDVFKLTKYDGNYSIEKREEVLAKTSWTQRRHFIDENNVVYERAKVTIKFSNCNYNDVELFDTIEQAIEYTQNLIEKGNLTDKVIRIN